MLFVDHPSRLNPHTANVHAAVVRAALGLGLALDAGKLHKSKISYLSGHTMPDATPIQLVVAGLWTTWFCMLDDFVESRTWSDGELEIWFERGGTVYHDGLYRMQSLAGDFGPHLRWLARELIAVFASEARNRRDHLTPSVSHYEALRALTVGVQPLLEMGCHWAGGHIPPLLAHHTALAVGYANDLFTWKREKAAGEIHNLVAVLMNEYKIDEATAIKEAVGMHDRHVAYVFASDAKCAGLARQMIKGHLDWAAMTGRYKDDYRP